MNAIVPIPPEANLFAAFSDFSHAPLSQKPVQRRFLSPEGVSLSVKALFAKKFSGAGEHFAGGACVRCCHALGGLRLRPLDRGNPRTRLRGGAAGSTMAAFARSWRRG